MKKETKNCENSLTKNHNLWKEIKQQQTNRN